MEHAGATAGTAKIDNDDRFIQEFERAKLEPARNGDIVKCAIDLQARRQFRTARNSGKSEVFAALRGDCADRRTCVHAEPGSLAINDSANKEMILPRANKWQRYKLRPRLL